MPAKKKSAAATTAPAAAADAKAAKMDDDKPAVAAAAAKPEVKAGGSSSSSSSTAASASASAAAASPYVTPGQRLGDTKSCNGGAGTYTLDGFVYASLVGVKRIATPAAAAPAPVANGLPTVEVVRDPSASASSSSSSGAALVVPATGDVVTARVTKVNERFAALEIVLVGTRLCKEPFSGTVRKRDVRKFDVDSVELYRMFRPGDIVRAEVISLGDTKSYFLSTAKNELGVVLAQSTAGHVMVPVSWEQMQCPVTQVKEYRKVAKVDTTD